MRPLPVRAYEFGEWRRAKVQADYHVEVKRAYYSVPYRMIGQRVDVDEHHQNSEGSSESVLQLEASTC